VLYETVEWTGNRKWWVLDGARVCDGWRYIKLVFRATWATLTQSADPFRRVLKIEAIHCDSIVDFIDSLATTRRYRSFSGYCHVDDVPPVDFSRDSTSSSDDGLSDIASNLDMLFPNLSVLLVMDNVATNYNGLKVHRSLGQIFKPLTLNALLDTLGACADHSSPSSSCFKSTQPSTTKFLRHVVLNELEIRTNGCLLNTSMTKQHGSQCKFQVPHRYHDVLPSKFMLKFASSHKASQIEEDATYRSVLLALSAPCLVSGTSDSVTLTVKCNLSRLDWLVNAVSDQTIANRTDGADEGIDLGRRYRCFAPSAYLCAYCWSS
jgi:hypothetical protein